MYYCTDRITRSHTRSRPRSFARTAAGVVYIPQKTAHT